MKNNIQKQWKQNKQTEKYIKMIFTKKTPSSQAPGCLLYKNRPCRNAPTNDIWSLDMWLKKHHSHNHIIHSHILVTIVWLFPLLTGSSCASSKKSSLALIANIIATNQKRDASKDTKAPPPRRPVLAVGQSVLRLRWTLRDRWNCSVKVGHNRKVAPNPVVNLSAKFYHH